MPRDSDEIIQMNVCVCARAFLGGTSAPIMWTTSGENIWTRLVGHEVKHDVGATILITLAGGI